jgi:hypothetical protein
MYCDVDGDNSKSNFENPYRKLVLVWEQRVRDKWHEDLGFKVELPEFSGALQAEGFIDWLHRVERIFDDKEVLVSMKVKLVTIKLKGRAFAWWEQLKRSRYRQGKPKINSWEKLVKHMRAAFLPHNHTQAMYQPSQSWTHGSRSVNRYMEKPYNEKTHVKMMEPKYQSVSRCNRGTCRQFQTTCTMRGKVVKLVMDPRSCNNVVSNEAVRKLGLNTMRYPTSYRLEWLTKGNKVTVSKRRLVSFSIGTKYMDTVWCDVADMDTCHLLLGRPWQHDKAATHDEENNKYNLMFDKVKFTLLHNQEPGPKPSQGDGQSFVAKQELIGKESSVMGVVLGLVNELLEGFSDMFQVKLPEEVPPLQDIQPQLDVVSGCNLPNHPHHNKSPKEHEELRQQVEEVNLSESIAIFHEDEELLEEVNHSNSLAVFDDNSIHHVLDESPEDEVFDFSLSNCPNNNLGKIRFSPLNYQPFTF